MSITIFGLAKTRAALERVSVQAGLAAAPACEAGGQVVQSAMVSRAPRDTGRLVSLLEVETDDERGGATARVGSTAPYDRFVQLGTVHMDANPYGERAAVAAAPGVVASMAPIFKAAVEA